MSAADPGRGDDFRCTYRLQLEPGRGFEQARQLVPYLKRLGVSHLYLSPVLEARTGSTHGYDVVDPTRVSDALGGETQLRSLSKEGLGIVLDIVPNHMAADEKLNPFWRDPLWRAKFFDVDWRTGSHRRFFDVESLAGVRVEDPEVFEITHRKVLELVRDGVVSGLRVDHPDGLANPARYVERLAESGARRVWVEKILAPNERLPPWPVAGTTGYEFMAEVTALFLDARVEGVWTELYGAATGERRSFEDVASEAKLEQARTTFAVEVDRLRPLLPADSSDADIAQALASLPLYRTYVDPTASEISDADRAVIHAADMDPRLQRLLALERRGHDAFVTRFQQTSPAVAAKGVEDTALYRYNRLLALNDVGADPGRFGLSVGAFHAACRDRQLEHPLTMLATSTHDTKRSADVRARLVALASTPEHWEALRQATHREAGELDDPNTEYFVLQTIVGAWPLSTERLLLYLEKALREAKRATSWIEPNTAWEGTVKAWAERLTASRRIVGRLEELIDDISVDARRVSIGMTLLKLTTPGTPDIYQGDEMPFYALVDPDNRRPVDWQASAAALEQSRPGSKIDVIRRSLDLRRRRPDPFAEDHVPMDGGVDICAFARGDEIVAAVALRGTLREWDPPRGSWRDVLAASDHVRLLERI